MNVKLRLQDLREQERQRRSSTSLESFRDHLICLGRSENTVSKYVRDARLFLEALGNPKQKRLDKESLMNVIDTFKGRYRITSLNSMIAAFNAYLIYIEREDITCKSFKVQKEIFRREDIELTREDYTNLLDEARCSDSRLYHACETLGATGIRVTELKFITVTALYEGRVLVENKGKVRAVILPEKLTAHLKEFALLHGIEEGPIFVTKNGKALDRSNLFRQMKTLAKKTGVDPKKVFPHNFRHLFAAIHYAKHKNLSHLADLLGHDSINTTRIYVATSGEEHLRELNELGLVA